MHIQNFKLVKKPGVLEAQCETSVNVRTLAFLKLIYIVGAKNEKMINVNSECSIKVIRALNLH